MNILSVSAAFFNYWTWLTC